MQASRRVLLIEDEALIAMWSAELLSELQFEAVQAFSADKALTALREDNGFAAIVMDLGMPDLGGEHLLCEVRRLAPETPLIVASGRMQAEVSGMLGKFDRAAYIAKPYDLGMLRGALRKLGVETAGAC
jgi:DNA-binding response OmpR family regulator